MRWWSSLLVAVLLLAGCALAQQPAAPGPAAEQNQGPPRSDNGQDADSGGSSSRDTRIDLSPPKDDAKNHPGSGVPAADPEAEPEANSDVGEMHPFNPYRALKDDEVGDFYLKQKNYRAALARYQDALVWKENDAVANFRMAQCYEKLKQPEEAATHYREYLKILPEGPFSKDAKKALEKLKAK
jgi:tetratricopeptide (TPR) repeat protein